MIERQGPDHPPALNNKKTGSNILKSGFQTLHNKPCRTMSPEKEENEQVRWVPQITTWTTFPDPHKGSGETQATWWSHWVKGTDFRVWRAKVARNYGPGYWEKGTTPKGSSKSAQRGPLNPWQIKARQRHWKEAVTTSEAHIGLRVVCIPNIQSGNTKLCDTQSIR